MGFEVVSPVGTEHLMWVPIDANAATGDTFYVGQLVKWGGDGVQPLGQASGTGDTSNKSSPAGVIVATNNKVPVWDTTYKAESITSVTPTQAVQLARDWTGAEGMHPKGDPQPMVQIAMVTPNTILKGPIYNAALGTAITEFTNTAASTDGLTVTKASTIGFTAVADLATLYCRKGPNQGLYRVTDSTSTTTYTVDMAFPYDIGTTDKFVYVPFRNHGPSLCQTDAEALYFEGGTSASLATNYWVIDVIRLDLEEAGRECVYFRFNCDHFCKLRA